MTENITEVFQAESRKKDSPIKNDPDQAVLYVGLSLNPQRPQNQGVLRESRQVNSRPSAEKFHCVSQYRSQQLFRHRTRALTNRIPMAGMQLPKQVMHIRCPRQLPLMSILGACQFSREPRLFSFDSRLPCMVCLVTGHSPTTCQSVNGDPKQGQ